MMATVKLGRGVWRAVLIASVVGGLCAASAYAKSVTVGQLFRPTESCFGSFTALVTHVASGRSYVVPKAGVITSWSFEDGATPVTGLRLKVGRSLGGGSYKIIGQAKAGRQTADAVHTYKTHIPVKAGDLIGYYNTGGTCDAYTGNSLDTYAYDSSTNVLPGTTASFTTGSDTKIPIRVRVREN